MQLKSDKVTSAIIHEISNPKFLRLSFQPVEFQEKNFKKTTKLQNCASTFSRYWKFDAFRIHFEDVMISLLS